MTSNIKEGDLVFYLKLLWITGFTPRPGEKPEVKLVHVVAGPVKVNKVDGMFSYLDIPEPYLHPYHNANLFHDYEDAKDEADRRSK